MAIVNGPEALADPLNATAALLALTSWAGDPAVLTAIASLLTAVAAFWRSRHRQAAAPRVPVKVRDLPPSLPDAYETLHEVEEKIREELLQQLQYLQEEAERISDQLTYYRHATVSLEEAVIRCPERSCPVREELQTP